MMQTLILLWVTYRTDWSKEVSTFTLFFLVCVKENYIVGNLQKRLNDDSR